MQYYYKLLDWIPLEKLNWNWLSKNPAAIHLLEQNPDKINWNWLSFNPEAIHLLEQHLDKIRWDWLSSNPKAIHILEQHSNKIYWSKLSMNPEAIHLISKALEQNLDKIHWLELSANPAAIHILEQNQDKIDGLVLEGAFSSHKDAANDRVPFLSRLFVREMYSAEKNIKHYKKPLLIIHSTEDTTIPYRHGERLLELANEPKELYTIDGRHVYGPLLYGDSIAQKLVELVQ